MKTFVIAEAGANHDRDRKKASRLIKVAAASGAAAIKFQLYKSSSLYVKSTGDIGKFKNVSDLIRSIELPREWLHDLVKECDDNGVEFMCTPFDEDAINALVSVGVKRMKIAAFEATDVKFVEKIAATNLPIIFSAGIGSTLDSVKKTIEIIRLNNDKEICVLHCNSSYPTPYRDINLGQMILLRDSLKEMNVSIGISDHTLGTLIPPIAVTHGAKVVEKHFTLDRNSNGPDHPFAIEPDELLRMCRDIENAEISMGIKETEYTESERVNEMTMAQRSIVSSKNIKAGDIIDESNTTTKRPWNESFLSAKDYNSICGKHFATVDIPIDTPIKIDDVSRRIP